MDTESKTLALLLESARLNLESARAAFKPHHRPKAGESFMRWAPEYCALLDAISEYGAAVHAAAAARGGESTEN